MASPGLKRRSLSKPGSASSNTSRAFYEPPLNKPTAAQIVRESREWLHAVSTRRPYTPKDQSRSLFGPSYMSSVSRPFGNAKYEVTYPAVSETPGISEVGRVSQAQSQSRGKSLRRLVSHEELLPARSAPSSGQRKKRDENQTSASGSNRSTKPSDEAKLELIGTQTRLLTHAQPRLITPSLSQMGTQRATGSATAGTGKDQAFVQRAKVMMAEAKKRGAKGGEASFRRSPVVSLPNSALLSAPRRPTPSVCSSSLGSNLDSGLDLRALSASNASPVQHSDYLFTEAHSVRGKGEIETQSRLSGSYRQGSQLLQTAKLSSTSGDSGLSSGSELDHLLARLNELPHQLNASKLSELDSDQVSPNLSPGVQSTQSLSVELYDSTIPDEQEAIILFDRIRRAISESGLGGKPKWSNRATLLQTAFSLLESPSARIRLAVTRLILTVQVTGSSLATVCKVMYEVSKEAQNDGLFLENPDTLDCLVHTLQQLDTPLPMVAPKSTTPTDPMISNLDAMLFCTGSLKFLAASPIVSESLYKHPVFLISLNSLHQQVAKRIRLLHMSQERNSDLEERLYLVLVQISDIFCNLTGNPGLRAKLITTGGITDHVIDCLLCQMHQQAPPPRSSAQYLVQFNWIRFLARLTEYTEVCVRLDTSDALADSMQSRTESLTAREQSDVIKSQCEQKSNTRITKLCNMLFSMIQAYVDDADLTVRIAYLLGNLTARLDSAREALFPNPLALEDLCELCRRYYHIIQKTSDTDRTAQNAYLEDPSNAWPDASNRSEVDLSPAPEYQTCLDVVNKLVRILANAAIGETVGHLSVVGTDCLDLFLDLIEHECPRRPTELLVNCLAGLNNITYYIHSETTPVVLAKQYDVTEVLIRTLGDGAAHPDVLLGVIRVFGNLTRQATVRDWISRQAGQLLLDGSQIAGVIEPPKPWPNTVPKDQAMLYILIQNLDSARSELVYSTLGVLINLMTDVEQRPAFKQLGGITKLVEVLRDFAGHDWQLAGLACKTLWNYTEAPKDSIRNLIDVEILNELYTILTEFTDQDIVDRMHQNFLLEDPNAEQENTALWKAAWSSEFFPVASELLARLNHC